MGTLLTYLHRLTLDNCERFGQLQNVRATETLKSSHRPHGRLAFARCLQGGGVAVWGGTVSIVNSQIYSNTAISVRAHLQKFASPQWETQVLLVVCRAVVSWSGEAQCQS
jgi:hypothetical protein